MQRLIVVGVVLMLLLGIGGGAGAVYYRQNRPTERWVPLPVQNVEVSKHQLLAGEIDKALHKEGVLLTVAKDVRLAQKWKLPSDEAAAEEIEKRMFVKLGTMDTQTLGVVPSINTGLTGKRKEEKVMDEVAGRLFEEVKRILGIKDRE